MKSSQAKFYLPYFLTYFLPASLLVLILAFWGMQQAQTEQLKALQFSQEKNVLNAKTETLRNLNLLIRDIQFLSTNALLQQVINGQNNPSSLKTDLLTAKNYLAADWQNLISKTPIYDQIRWIDENGNEQVRIDNKTDFALRVPDAELQNKADRYYFSQSVGLNIDQFYFSPFDLNVERGQVEIPYKPMIRLAKAVVDQQGNKRGVIVINYRGAAMLQAIKALQGESPHSIWLTNAQGYWLLASQAENEWGFMFDKPELTLAKQFPDAWQQIIKQEKGVFTNQNGVWQFDTVRPMQYAQEKQLADMSNIMVKASPNGKVKVNGQLYNPYFWKIVSFTPEAEVVSITRSVRMPYYVGILLVLLIIFIGSLYLTRSRLNEEQALQTLKDTNQELDKTSKQLALDIMAKEIAQQGLEESLERYSSVLSASIDGFVLMNKYGIILETNHSLFDILQLQQKEIEGSFLGTLFEGEQRQKIADRIGNLFVSGFCRFEVECERNNSKFYTEITLMPVHTTQEICAFMRDITQDKENDFKLETSASIFQHANEGIMLTDAKFVVMDVNQEFQFITGFNRDEVINEYPGILSSNKQSKEYYDDMKQDLLQKGHWYGELWSRRKTGELFLAFLTISQFKNPNDQSIYYAWMFSDITLEKQYQKRLQNSAHYDILTGLPNRFLLKDRLDHAMMEAVRNEFCVAIVFVDLDGFKAINDQYGHDMGDFLLISVAKEMKKVLRATDTVARIGGDEFVVLMSGLHHQDEALPIIEKLLQTISQPFHKSDHVLQVSGSLGVTFYAADNALDGDQLIRQADQAMYQAKQLGKNGYHIFDTQKDSLNRDLFRNLNRVEQGLMSDEFVLHYQPKVSLLDDEVIGMEALIRWQHPEKGLLYPGDFLSCVEDTQVSIVMSEWVIRKALSQLLEWQKQGINLPVSINIGAVELQKDNFVNWALNLINEYPSVSPTMIEFEVLETSALEDVLTVKQIIKDCKNRGVSFALDDFGTGFASLSYLKRLPIETIKIDQSFIKNMFDDPEEITLLEGLIGLTKSLKRTVIAEGIETEKHGCMLLELGCYYGQGYFIAKPMPPTQFPDWLASWKRPDSWVNTASFKAKE